MIAVVTRAVFFLFVAHVLAGCGGQDSYYLDMPVPVFDEETCQGKNFDVAGLRIITGKSQEELYCDECISLEPAVNLSGRRVDAADTQMKERLTQVEIACDGIEQIEDNTVGIVAIFASADESCKFTQGSGNLLACGGTGLITIEKGKSQQLPQITLKCQVESSNECFQ